MPGSPPSLRILLAEDNPADTFLVKLALSRAGIDASLQVFTDGEQAIRFVERVDAESSSQPIDLILLDFQLPKRDGLEVLDRIRSSRYLGTVPVLLTTTSERPEIQRAAESIPRVHFFRKPLSFREFMMLGPLVKSICQPASAAFAAS